MLFRSPAPQIDPTWEAPSSVLTASDWDSGNSGVDSGSRVQYENRPETPSSVHTRTSLASSRRPLPPNPPTYGGSGRSERSERRYDAPGEYEGGGIAEDEMDAKLRLDEEEMFDRDYMQHEDDLDDIDDEGDHRNPRSSRQFHHHHHHQDRKSVV